MRKEQTEQSSLGHKLIIKSLANVEGTVRPSALWILDWWHIVRSLTHMERRLLSSMEVTLRRATHSIPIGHILSHIAPRFTAS